MPLRRSADTAAAPVTGPQAWPVHRWKNGAWQHFADDISPEVPVLVRWADGERLLWAWPEDLAPLCLGHVLLDCRAEAAALPEATPLPRMRGSVRPLTPPPDSPAHAAFQVALTPAAPLPRPAHPADSLNPPEILRRMEEFLHMQGACPDLWAATGCFHRAALFAPAEGAFLHLAEDIGRHNCLDRLAGWACLHGAEPSGLALFVSARITASLYAKARRAGFRCIISRSAVTTAAVTLAQRDGKAGDSVTLIGFCRPLEHRFTVFAGGMGRGSASCPLPPPC